MCVEGPQTGTVYPAYLGLGLCTAVLAAAKGVHEVQLIWACIKLLLLITTMVAHLCLLDTSKYIIIATA